MVRSALGTSSCRNKRRNDGTAMPTRISTGISVHATSIRVLWVVLDGTGLALALNLTTTTTRSASTNSVIRVISTNRKLWNQVMLSITGEADSCNVHSHGAGCPNSASAAPPVASATPATVKPSNRRPTWPIDILMPLPLPSKVPQSIAPDGDQCCTIRPLTNGLGKYLEVP